MYSPALAENSRTESATTRASPPRSAAAAQRVSTTATSLGRRRQPHRRRETKRSTTARSKCERTSEVCAQEGHQECAQEAGGEARALGLSICCNALARTNGTRTVRRK